MPRLVLKQGGHPQGYALVSFAGPQLRIADFVIGSNDEREWISALAALVNWAALQPGIAEIAAASSLNLLRRTYTAAGFRPDGLGALVNSSRGITACFKPAEPAWEAAVEAATRATVRALAEATPMGRLAAP